MNFYSDQNFGLCLEDGGEQVKIYIYFFFYVESIGPGVKDNNLYDKRIKNKKNVLTKLLLRVCENFEFNNSLYNSQAKCPKLFVKDYCTFFTI